MSEKKRTNLTLLEKTFEALSEQETLTDKTVNKQTNPIMRKMVVFRQENIGKFTVKDLFKK